MASRSRGNANAIAAWQTGAFRGGSASALPPTSAEKVFRHLSTTRTQFREVVHRSDPLPGWLRGPES